MSEELNILPCPFCDGKATYVTRYPIGDYNCMVLYYDILCTNIECYLQDGADWSFNTKEEALEMWNKRNKKS